MSKKVQAKFFVTVKPKFGRRWDRATGWVTTVDSIRVASLTQKRPEKPLGVVVQLTVEFNEEAFLPLQPSAIISIPDSMVQAATVISVDAEDDNGLAVAEHLAEQLRKGQSE